MRKKIFILVLITIVVSVFIFTGCNKEHYDYSIDVLQLVTHPALDDAYLGFKDELTALLNADGKTVAFNVKNAEGDEENCTTISEQFKVSDSDMVYAIATPAAIAAAGAITEKPIIFAAVTDAEVANLVDTNEVPKYNVSGVSDDLAPIQVKKQLELIKLLVPGITKIAFVYNSGEPNSVAQLATVRAKIDEFEMGLTVVEKAITDQNEIAGQINSIDASEIGAIYLPTDNMIANAAEAVHVANKARTTPLPIVAAETGINDSCGIATYGLSYYEMGKQAARMAYRVLVEGADISATPVEWSEKNPVLSINQTVADEIGFEIPQTVLDLAN